MGNLVFTQESLKKSLSVNNCFKNVNMLNEKVNGFHTFTTDSRLDLVVKDKKYGILINQKNCVDDALILVETKYGNCYIKLQNLDDDIIVRDLSKPEKSKAKCSLLMRTKDSFGGIHFCLLKDKSFYHTFNLQPEFQRIKQLTNNPKANL